MTSADVPAAVARRSVRAVATAAAGIAAVVLLDPEHRHVPLCPFHALTGLQCPLCGSLRAVDALAHGQVTTALHANLLFVAALPLVVGFWLDRQQRSASGRGPRTWPGWTAAAVVATAVAFTVVRNLPGAEVLRPG